MSSTNNNKTKEVAIWAKVMTTYFEGNILTIEEVPIQM